jgi:hypothetical protein
MKATNPLWTIKVGIGVGDKSHSYACSTGDFATVAGCGEELDIIDAI